MKSAMHGLVLAVVLGMQGGEPGNAMQLYRDGRFAEAAAAFRAAIERDGDTAELQWNLALASWRAGDLVAAETAAEKYAAMSKQARTDLHAGLLGAVRHAEAKALEQQADRVGAQPPAAAAPDSTPPADPLPMLEQALQKATQAKDWFVRGAAASTTPELLRNAERSLRTIDELQKKIDELKKQREQQPKDDEQKQDDKQDDKKDDEKKNEDKDEQQEKQEPKPDEQQEPKPDEKGEQKPPPEQPPQGDEKPEPKPGQPDEQPKDGGKQGGGSGEAQGEPNGEPGERNDAPGEAREGKELTPEQLQRLLEQLRKTDDQAKEIRLRSKTARRVVERDW